MVVSPTDLRKVTEDEQRVLDTIEAKIDGYLAENFEFDSGSVYVPYFEECEEVRYSVLKQFLGQYVTAGWSEAKVVSDQRDGRNIVFRDSKGSSSYYDR